MKNIEEKKKYQSPKMEIVEMRGKMNLLEGSGAADDSEALDQNDIEVFVEDQD